jgi:hypothetical protein
MHDFPILPGPRTFPPHDPNSRRMGSSGTYFVPDPSPSPNPAILGEVDKADRVRQNALATVAQAAVIAGSICQTARAIHVDEKLTVVERHRHAHEQTACVVFPLADTVAKTQAVYAKAIETLHEKLDGPALDKFSDGDIERSISTLLGLPPQQRFAKVRKSIEQGGDLAVAVLMKSDPFLVDGVISDGERAAILDLWRRARFPEDYTRLTRLEADVVLVNNTARIIENYQKAMSNQSISTAAGGIPPMMTNQRGAPGPGPRDRGIHSMSLAERAAATTRMIAAAGR